MLKYPARFEPIEGGGFFVTFRDIPEAASQGLALEEALLVAADTLSTAVGFYLEDRRSIPCPSSIEEGEELVALSGSMSEKVLAFNKTLA